jgi:hypothetical protein
MGEDRSGHRAGFVELVQRAKRISGTIAAGGERSER